MNPLAQAFEALRRNAGTVVAYLAAVFAISVVNQTVYIHYRDVFTLPGPLPVSVALVRLTADLAVCAASALVQSVAFSFLAKDMDRPLWRLKGTFDAIRRFFPLWFVINLILVAIVRILQREDNPEGVANLFLMVLIVWFLLGIPLGAAIMFTGRVAWSQLAADVRPLGRQFHHTLFVLFLLFFEFYLFISIPMVLPTEKLNPATQVFVLPLFDVALGLIDVVAFSWIFFICRHDRDAHKDDTGLDF